MTTPTLEQLRAADAWARAKGQNREYKNLAKGLAALIMNSGLLQVLAFLHEKGSSKPPQQHCENLGGHLRTWLQTRFPRDIKSAEFAPFMESLMKASPATFQQITAEAFAWLRWSRQMAAAVIAESTGGER